MEIKILTEGKDFIEVELDNLTIAELMRVYLNKQNVKMAAWRREHPTKNPILRVESEDVKKIFLKAVEEAQKELDDFASSLKKSK